MPIPTPIPNSRWSMRVLRNAAGPVFTLMMFGGIALVVGNFLDDEPARPWVLQAGGWMLGVGVVLTLLVPFAAVYFVVHEAAAGYPHRQVIDRPTMPPKADGQARQFEHGLAELGFEHAGWVRLDDFDETHSGLWRHPANGAIAVLMYLPITPACKLRFVRKYPDGWVLASSTRQTDLSVAPPPEVYLQVRTEATAADLWAWHREAEELFPRRSRAVRGTAPSPLEVCLEGSRRQARHVMRRPLWFLRLNPFSEAWRMGRGNGVSVREQIDRGWVTDPALTFPEPDAR